MKAALTLVLVAGSTLPVRATDDFSGYVVQLAATNPEREAVRAERALIEAGQKAFPTILAHLDDSAPLQPRLANRAVRGTPTVGGRCFDILQVQIEGNWPKGFRQFYILTPSNVGRWLDAHKSLSLHQLKLISREESLRRAERELAANPSDNLTKCVDFLREEIRELKQ